MISTRGRYALRVLVDLAEHRAEGYIPMKDIATRQGISLKYLERIIPQLSRHGIVEGVQGKGGGYRLVMEPSECQVGDVLRLTEGDLAPVACLAAGATPCDKKDMCRTYPLWTEFYRMVNDFFDQKTVADMMRPPQKKAEE